MWHLTKLALRSRLVTLAVVVLLAGSKSGESVCSSSHLPSKC